MPDQLSTGPKRNTKPKQKIEKNKIMKSQKQIRILLALNIAGSVGLLIWWSMFPVLLPLADTSQNFQEMILDSNWTVINLLGLLSSLLLCLGLPGIFLAQHMHFKMYGYLGLLLACTGLILFTAIQYYETLIWPAAAQINPVLLHSNGALVSGDSGVVAGLLISAIVMGSGYVLLGIAALRIKKYKKTAIWLLMVGAVVFGNGIVFPVRTIGLVLFVIGTFWLSVLIRKQAKNQTL
jgi:hypothetical protein